jgi:carbon-monoxide dehydrogenase small subunit
VKVTFELNGAAAAWEGEPRRSLLDAVREDLALTGTHGGCEHGVCGACTVLVDGAAVRACLMLAVQVAGRRVTTIEGIAPADGLHPVQDALSRHHGLQCGYCTPGMVVGLIDLLGSGRLTSGLQPANDLAGHLCRCTGYAGIVAAAEELANDVGQASRARGGPAARNETDKA